MKKLVLFFISILVLAGCNGLKENIIIDWVDFIHINDTKYNSLYSAVIADQSFIGDEVGEVEFKVSDNVSDPSYKTKNGDAAFWEKGTKIYSVKGLANLIAVEDKELINGYRIYSTEDGPNWHYKDMDQSSIRKVEIYEGYTNQKLINAITDKKEIEALFALLDSGETNSNYNPDISNGDPAIYPMVFYSEEPLAYEFSLFYDSKEWYWHPWDTSIVSSEIAAYVKK